MIQHNNTFNVQISKNRDMSEQDCWKTRTELL